MSVRIAIPVTMTAQPLRGLMLLPVLCTLLLSVYTRPCLAAALTEERSAPETETLQIHHVIHFIGLADVKRNLSGDLSFGDGKITFASAGDNTAIPDELIVAFSSVHDTVPLIKGFPGQVAAMAPYGAGQAISMIRNGVDTLTLLYQDSNHAVHGTVFLFPKGQGEKAVHALTTRGISQHEYPRSGALGPTGSIDRTEAAISNGKPSLEVVLVTESADDVPAAFPVAIYEELIARLAKSGEFTRIWRQGDTRIDPSVQVLHIDIQGFKKGSERRRSLVPFWGSTTIKSNVQLRDHAQNVLLEKQINAAVRFHGENMGAGHGLCKKVEKALNKVAKANDSK